jgi:hypothetical protein
VTLSVYPDFHRGRPRVLRGMLPFGVRTFLQQTPKVSAFTSDHLPSSVFYHSTSKRKLQRAREAYAPRVRASTSSRSQTLPEHRSLYHPRLDGRLFRRDAETSTPEAGATRNCGVARRDPYFFLSSSTTSNSASTTSPSRFAPSSAPLRGCASGPGCGPDPGRAPAWAEACL